MKLTQRPSGDVFTHFRLNFQCIANKYTALTPHNGIQRNMNSINIIQFLGRILQ